MRYWKLLEFRAECNGVFNSWWLLAVGPGEPARKSLERQAKEPGHFGERKVVEDIRRKRCRCR